MIYFIYYAAVGKRMLTTSSMGISKSGTPGTPETPGTVEVADNWQCIPGINTPVRRNKDGYVQCLGKFWYAPFYDITCPDCAWTEETEQCLGLLASTKGYNPDDAGEKMLLNISTSNIEHIELESKV